MRIWLLALFAFLCVSCSTAGDQKSAEPAPKVPVTAKQDPIEKQLVQLHIPLGGTSPTPEQTTDYAKLEQELDAAANKAGVGKLDGNEIGEGEYTIWLYGKDATKLAEVVKLALKGKTMPKGCKLFLRHGGVKDSAAKEETISLDN